MSLAGEESNCISLRYLFFFFFSFSSFFFPKRGKDYIKLRGENMLLIAKNEGRSCN